MLEIINSIVLIMFGGLIGILLQIFGKYSELDEKRRRVLPEKKSENLEEDKDFRAKLHRFSERQEEENKILLSSLSRKVIISMIGLYGFIAMVIIVLYYSPLYMNWWIFLGSVFAGFLIGERLFSSAKVKAIEEGI